MREEVEPCVDEVGVQLEGGDASEEGLKEGGREGGREGSVDGCGVGKKGKNSSLPPSSLPPSLTLDSLRVDPSNVMAGTFITTLCSSGTRPM